MKEWLLAALPLLLPCSVPAVAISAYCFGAPWAFRSILWIYMLGLAADFVAGEDTSDRNETRIMPRVLTWLWVPVHALLILIGLLATKHSGTSLTTICEMSIAVGAAGGMFGIPVGHELMHRANRLERALAELQMTMFGYAHFCIEHVEGHHVRVGTLDDPATARFGETLYAFLPRTVFGGLVSAFRIEARRLREAGLAVVGIHNRMLRYALMFLSAVALVAAAFGWKGVVFFLMQGAVSVLIIETINYVEHYGLTRREGESVTPMHSWNSSHRVSNWLLFNVPRHSDHHDDAGRPYPLLRHAGGVRQLPAGYFAMFVLALFPPLWTAIMHRLLELDEVHR